MTEPTLLALQQARDFKAEISRIEDRVATGEWGAALTFTKMRELIDAALASPVPAAPPATLTAIGELDDTGAVVWSDARVAISLPAGTRIYASPAAPASASVATDLHAAILKVLSGHTDMDCGEKEQIAKDVAAELVSASVAEPVTAAKPTHDDGFNGDTPHLIRCIEALLRLDEAGALAPHGIGGHARGLLSAAASRLGAAPVPVRMLTDDELAEVLPISPSLALRGMIDTGIRKAFEVNGMNVGAAPAAEGAKPGWKLVPAEPTPEMVRAIDAVMWPGASEKAYRAMLAAAPSGGSEGAPAEGVKVLNALQVLERSALGPESQGTAEQFLRCLGEAGMFVISNPLVAASPSEGSAGDAPTPSVTDSRCNYVAFAGRVCNKCGQQHDGGGPPWPGIIDIDAPEFQLRQPGEHENPEDEAAVAPPASPAGTAVPGMTQEKN